MLTNIEWWGGLLIVWGALACRFMARPSTPEGRWFSLLSLLTYGLMGVVFSLYFYELQQPWLRYAFVTATALAGVCMAVLMVLFFRLDDGDEDIGEQGGAGVAFFAAALMLTPLVVPFALVGLKSWTVIQLL